jgi:hypothetical protein
MVKHSGTRCYCRQPCVGTISNYTSCSSRQWLIFSRIVFSVELLGYPGHRPCGLSCELSLFIRVRGPIVMRPKYTLEITEGAIKNGQFRKTGNIEYTRHKTK